LLKRHYNGSWVRLASEEEKEENGEIEKGRVEKRESLSVLENTSEADAEC
jgi:hypothetical protein